MCYVCLMLISEQVIEFSLNNIGVGKCCRKEMTGHLGAEASLRY